MRSPAPYLAATGWSFAVSGPSRSSTGKQGSDEILVQAHMSRSMKRQFLFSKRAKRCANGSTRAMAASFACRAGVLAQIGLRLPDAARLPSLPPRLPVFRGPYQDTKNHLEARLKGHEFIGGCK